MGRGGPALRNMSTVGKNAENSSTNPYTSTMLPMRGHPMYITRKSPPRYAAEPCAPPQYVE